MARRVTKAEAFEFTTFKQVGDNEIAFNYLVHFTDGAIEKFQEKLVFPFKIKTLDKRSKSLLRQIHIVLGINYYKLYAPRKIRAQYTFDAMTASFWNKIYKNGLGEFAYVNGINPHHLGNFKATRPSREGFIVSKAFKIDGKYLTGIGGGKDSLVAWELIKQANIKQTAFACESPSHNNFLRRQVIDEIDPKSLIAMRRPDPKLDILRKEGLVYRGHSPMSAIVAFVALFCAYQRNLDGFIVANESSSNEYNLTWRGVKINHQWTKTANFEKSINDHLKYIGIPLVYISVVRPMNELMITALFSRMQQYHNKFFSCNKSILDKKGNPKKWCGNCAKCASATLLLAPFVSPVYLKSIIGVNMLDNINNVELFAELAGFSGDKPFECVCTKEEARAILRAISENHEYRSLPVIQELVRKYDDEEPVVTIEDLLKFMPAGTFPKDLAKKLLKVISTYGVMS